MGGLSLRLEEVYVLQSTGGSGLCERLMVIVGRGCEGPSCIFTSCCTRGPGGFRKLPGLWATHPRPPRESRRKKGSIPVYQTHCSSFPCSQILFIPSYRHQSLQWQPQLLQRGSGGHNLVREPNIGIC